MKNILLLFVLLSAISYGQLVKYPFTLNQRDYIDSVRIVDSTSQRTYSDLKYVDKTTAQTIIGQKNFSGTVKVGSDTSMILGYMDGTIRTGIHINQLAGHPYGFNRIFKTVPLNPLNASWSMLTRAGDFTAGGVSDHMVFLGYNQDAELVDLQFGQGMEATYDVDDTTVISEWYSYYLSRPSLPTYSVRPFQVGTFRYGSSAPYRYTSSATIAADAFFLISEGGANMIEFRSQTYGATTTQTGTRYSGTLSNALGNSMMYIQDSLWIFHEKNNFGWLYQGDPSGSARELMRLDNSGIYGHVKISPLGVCDIDFGSPIYGSIDWRNKDTTGIVSIYKEDGTNRIHIGGNDGMVTNKLEITDIPMDTTGLNAGQFYLDPLTGVIKYTVPENIFPQGNFTSWSGILKQQVPNGFYSTLDTLHAYIEQSPIGKMHYVNDGTDIQYVTVLDSNTIGETYGYSFTVSQVVDTVRLYITGEVSVLISSTGVYSGVSDPIEIKRKLFVLYKGDDNSPCEVTLDDIRIWRIGGNVATTTPTIYVPDTTGITDGYIPKLVSGEVVWSPDVSTSGSGLFNPDGVTIDTTAGGLARVLPAKVTKWDSVSNKQNADADLTDLADGELTASKVGGVKDADYGDVTVSSGVWSVENNSHDHTNMFDTLAISWGILDTTYTGSLSGWKVPNDITITEISAYTDANTCTFNLEERGETTPNTAGTDVMGSDLVADNNQQETSSFTNANIAKNTWLVPTISATGDVSIFSITIRYIKQ